MDATASRAGKARRDRLRPLRYAWRTPLLLGHIALSLPLTLGVILSPLGRIGSAAGDPWKHRVVRWWSRNLVRVFGIRAVTRGTPLAGGVLLVSNHRSWLDIELIHAFRMACFVAKAEIERWPMVGWLASQAGTIYHRRGSTESLSGVSGTMVERLREGFAVAVFPEGGIRPGNRVHTFHARIFQAAIDARVPAQPVALRVTRDGAPCDALSERPREGFLGCFLRVLGEPRTDVEVLFLEPVHDDGSGRRRMADACRAQILAALGQVDVPRRGARGEAAVDDADPLADETAAADAADDARP
ncbi:MAG: 1-acyl-sn-glycerol-3-phosphate acyltransferase [Xanthomonadaceae bacterium]|jgi:1-acyl-sn-glycerol-3-phosphate acyltransferase|nr:1-acyl-sn-glycerol-3-phosphate acyltransferase [Xanthomonadaceae bacterium]